MHQYELTVIFPLEEDQFQAGKETVLANLAAQEVEITKTDEIGERDLAYEINKRKKGRYIFYTLKADPVKIALLDKVFKLNANLLRYLFIRIEE